LYLAFWLYLSIWFGNIMQAIIFMGIQASGKTSFYKEYFFNSHVRISLDLLNTRNKQSRFLQTCFDTHSRFVIDNTNPRTDVRAEFIEKANQYKYEVIGYYFKSSLMESLQRNSKRKGKEQIPEAGIRKCYASLELPSFNEGFHSLYYVELTDSGFMVKDWESEI